MSSSKSQKEQKQKLVQELEAARKEATELQGLINRKREATNDSSLKVEAASVPAMSKLALRQRRHLKGHTNKVTSVEWFRDSERLASVSQDGKMMIWQANSTNKLQVITLASSWVMSLGVSPEGKLTACGGLDNLVSIFNLKECEAETSSQVKGKLVTNRPKRELIGHVGFITACKFIDEGQILSASGDSSCILWDIERSVQKLHFQGHDSDVMGVALMGPNQFVTASGDHTARLWDIRTGDCVAFYEGHTLDLSCVDAFPDGNAFVTGSDDGTARLFDIRTDRQMAVYGTGQQIPLTSVAFTHSGRGIFTSYEDPTIRLWDSLKAECNLEIKTSTNDEMRVSRLAVSPDGNGLATASWDTDIKIWA